MGLFTNNASDLEKITEDDIEFKIVSRDVRPREIFFKLLDMERLSLHRQMLSLHRQMPKLWR